MIVSGTRLVEHRGHHVDERHLGHHGPPPVRTLAEEGALEQSAGAQPAGRDPRPVDQPVPVEAVRDRGDVVEGVLLVAQAAVEPPAPAHLAAAARVGMHPHDAAVEQRRQGVVPLRLVDRLVGAVGVDQAGRGAVERACRGGVPAPPAPAVPSGDGKVRRSTA